MATQPNMPQPQRKSPEIERYERVIRDLQKLIAEEEKRKHLSEVSDAEREREDEEETTDVIEVKKRDIDFEEVTASCENNAFEKAWEEYKAGNADSYISNIAESSLLHGLITACSHESLLFRDLIGIAFLAGRIDAGRRITDLLLESDGDNGYWRTHRVWCGACAGIPRKGQS